MSAAALKIALDKEVRKLARQEAAIEATQAMIEVLEKQIAIAEKTAKK